MTHLPHARYILADNRISDFLLFIFVQYNNVRLAKRRMGNLDYQTHVYF